MTRYAVYRWYGDVIVARVGRTTEHYHWVGGRKPSEANRKITHAEALIVTDEATARRIAVAVSAADRVMREAERVIDAECRARILIERDKRDAVVREILA